MQDQLSFEKCLTYIGAQLGPKPSRTRRVEKRPPSVTISRQTGAAGLPVAHALAAFLQRECPRTERPWTVFDKNLVEQVLADHNLPKELARYMPEDRVSAISDMIEELLGLHPSADTLLRQTTETMLHLAELGNVILVGRAANVITARLENIFHARLIGSPDVRVKRVEDHYQLRPKAALKFMLSLDRARQRYVRRYFHHTLDDPLLYHLVVNTDRIQVAEAAELIGTAVLRKFY